MTVFDKQFWRYSSKNIIGQTPHPRTKHIRERVLNMWAALSTLQDISDDLDLSQDTVHSYIKRARRRGDPRAITRNRHWRRRAAKADQRRDQIFNMHMAGMEVVRIAKILGVSRRLVEIRINEADIPTPMELEEDAAKRKDVEARIIKMHVEGVSSNEIARDVGLAPSKVRRHIKEWWK